MTSIEILLIIALAGAVIPGGKAVSKQAVCLMTSGRTCAVKAKKQKKKKSDSPDTTTQITPAS